MKKNLYINDINIGDYGIYISSDTYLNAPLIDYTEFQAPARDGNLILDNKRLNNVIRKFDCYIPDSYDLEAGLNSLKKLIYSLRGYLKIVSDYDPDVYQYGYFAEELNVEPFTTKSAQFSLYFSCLPQQWFISNDPIFLNNGTPSYSTHYRSSNDPTIQNILSKAKNNYNAPNGWIFGSISSDVIESNTTVNIHNASDRNKQYMVLAKYSNGEYDIVSEIDNYNYDISYTTRTSLSCTIEYLIPNTNISPLIRSTWENGSASLSETWFNLGTISNDNAFGCSPVLYYRKSLSTSYMDGEGVIDLFSLNENIYSLDTIRLVNDYTQAGILDNFSENDYISILSDFYNCNAYIVDANVFDPSIKYDISNYFTGNFRTNFGSNVDIKYGCLRNRITSELFIHWSISAAMIKAGWWKL